jgi:EAL and modified HD-GYP domain-containing signal transduction protein
MNPRVSVGRQAIFNRDLQLVAYELLFRDHPDGNSAAFLDGDQATLHVIENTLYEIGFRNLVGDKPAFINLTRSFLMDESLLRLRKDEVVLEVLEHIDVDEVLLARLRVLSAQGYAIALDDFIYDPKHRPLIELADLVKVDISLISADQLAHHTEELRRYSVKLLAEKIESPEQLAQCRELGFDLYQGYALAEPDTVTLATLTPDIGDGPDPKARRRR